MPLYKYFNHHGVDVLKNLRLKVTPPNQFNDPFEFSPFVASAVTPEDIQDLVDTTSAEDLYREMQRQGEAVLDVDTLKSWIKENSPFFLTHGQAAFQESYEEITAKQLDSASEHIGVVCLSEEENNLLMWSHYADSHKGILIGFNHSHEYFRKHADFREARYGKKRAAFSPAIRPESLEADKHFEEIVLTKNEAWKYEREWRGIFWLETLDKEIISDDKVLHFTPIPGDLVCRVVLGCRCSVQLEKEVRNAIQSSGLKVDLYRASIHKTDFALDLRAI